MPNFEVAWSFGGYTTVAARDEDEAREIFQDLCHDTLLKERHASEEGGLDVKDVYPGDADVEPRNTPEPTPPENFPTAQVLRQMAIDKYAEDDVEILPGAEVDLATDFSGAWVTARVWVTVDLEDFCDDCGRNMTEGELHTADCESALEQDEADGTHH
jgi:hypothetical protein